jgi:hypothetical protein
MAVKTVTKAPWLETALPDGVTVRGGASRTAVRFIVLSPIGSLMYYMKLSSTAWHYVEQS